MILEQSCIVVGRGIALQESCVEEVTRCYPMGSVKQHDEAPRPIRTEVVFPISQVARRVASGCTPCHQSAQLELLLQSMR